MPVHELDAEEARHVVKVLRAKVGDPCVLTNGRGDVYQGVIQHVDKRSCILETRWLRCDPPPARALQLVVAPTKATDRFEWMLEKAMELGVEGIWPVLTERSERSREKPERWLRILVSALKQSQQTRLPELHPILTFPEALQALKGQPGFIAHCLPAVEESGEKRHLLRAAQGVGSAWVAIGPEGDFTREEIQLALKAGAREVSLGETRLRTETAGVIAAHSYHLAGL